VSLNDHALLETILQDEVFLGVVGMLEYDPEFPTLKANYRDFLTKTTKFRSVVEIVEPHILAKIHQTYRLSYLKDVILARVLDDPMFSVLNSFIFFHQVDIVGFCTSCEAFLVPLFALWNEGYQLTPAMILKRRQTEKEALAETSEEQKAQREERKRDGMILIQQLCAMGKQVQLPARISLYRSLVDWGLLRVLEWALQQNSAETRLRNAAAEVLLTIIEYDANSVRAHILVQAEHKLSTPLSTLLIDSLHAEQDLGLKTQMAEAMRVLFDTGIEGAASAGNAVVQSLAAAAAAAAGSKAKDEADRFLTFIYESDIERLFSPLSTLPNFREIAAGTHVDLQPRARSALFGHLCDLLCYVMANHTFRSQYFVITSEIAISVAALLAAREKHMRLAALRFFRACLARNNQFINRHLVKIELLGAVLDVVEREERRDNLVASAVLDFFFHIRKVSAVPCSGFVSPASSCAAPGPSLRQARCGTLREPSGACRCQETKIRRTRCARSTYEPPPQEHSGRAQIPAAQPLLHCSAFADCFLCRRT
jgi:protein phosphatase-4 regulatory subunit 3